jgi:hypothetical protein
MQQSRLHEPPTSPSTRPRPEKHRSLCKSAGQPAEQTMTVTTIRNPTAAQKRGQGNGSVLVLMLQSPQLHQQQQDRP